MAKNFKSRAKKQSKAQQKEALKKAGLSYAEINRLSEESLQKVYKESIQDSGPKKNAKELRIYAEKEQKRQARNAKNRANYRYKKDLIERSKVDAKPTESIADIKAKIQAENRKKRANALRDEKRDFLLKHGFEPDQIKSSWLNEGWDKIEARVSGKGIYKTNEYLLIMFGDKTGELDVASGIQYFDGWSNRELANFGEKKVKQKGRDGSSGMPGDTIIFTSSDKSEIQKFKSYYIDHGYQTVIDTSESGGFTEYAIRTAYAFCMMCGTEADRDHVTDKLNGFLKRNKVGFRV